MRRRMALGVSDGGGKISRRGRVCSRTPKRKGIRLSQGASAGDDVIQLAVTVSGAPAADALKKSTNLRNRMQGENFAPGGDLTERQAPASGSGPSTRGHKFDDVYVGRRSLGPPGRPETPRPRASPSPVRRSAPRADRPGVRASRPRRGVRRPRGGPGDRRHVTVAAGRSSKCRWAIWQAGGFRTRQTSASGLPWPATIWPASAAPPPLPLRPAPSPQSRRLHRPPRSRFGWRPRPGSAAGR